MFKKLASLLFEEEDVPPEIDEEKVDLLKEKKDSESIFLKKKNENQILNTDPLEKTKKSSFENIKADDHSTEIDLSVKQNSGEALSEPVRTPISSFVDRKPQITKDVYDFKPVISPMFGIAESEKDHIRPTFVQTAEVKNDSHLQTVISPYYGAIHKDLKTGPEYQQNPISMIPTQTVSKAKVSEYVEENKPIEIKNISLEELIQPSSHPLEQETPNIEMNVDEKPEDVTQFSLFGED